MAFEKQSTFFLTSPSIQSDGISTLYGYNWKHGTYSPYSTSLCAIVFSNRSMNLTHYLLPQLPCCKSSILGKKNVERSRASLSNSKFSDETNCHFKSIQQKYNRIEMCGHYWLDGKAYFIILHWVMEATYQTWYECEKDICLHR